MHSGDRWQESIHSQKYCGIKSLAGQKLGEY